MISIVLTSNEILQLPDILPVYGSLETLELVESILGKCKISSNDDIETGKKVEFEQEEIDFIKNMISILDVQQNLSFESLSLIRKIINQGEI